MKRPFSKLAIAAALCGLSGGGFALGFGRLNSVAVLGQTLNLPIAVRLEPSEDLISTCVVADVYFGDTKQLPDLVQVRIEGQPGIASERTLRVLTSSRVTEPVVTLYLVAGCQSKVTRKFVVFADPPAASEPPVALATLEGPVGGRSNQGAEQPFARTEESVYSGLVPPPPAARSTTEHAGGSSKRGATRAAKKASAQPAPVESDRVAPAATPVRAKAEPVVVAGLDTRGVQVSRQGKRHKPDRSARVPAEAVGQSRLVLDPIESDMLVTPELRLSAELSHVEDDAGAAGQAVRERREAAAALWRALNASPEQLAHDRQRLQELEARLNKVQADNRAAQEQVVSLEAQVKRAEEQRATGPLVFGLAGLSVALTMALGWLLLRQRRAAQNEWWSPPAADEPDQPAPTEPARHTLAPSGTGLPTPAVETASLLKTADEVDVAALSPVRSAPPPVVPQIIQPVTQPLPRAALREVSVEELIDLEQQAEFFMVLGQDDAAIDLLQGHIESTEGTSPLPYLKLLEVYQRAGRREAYEGIRERFNAQFNAYAPAWEADLQQGHVLADYVGVIERLQALWDAPERAMEVLQASLLRRNPDADTFDLPAYRELLFLYSVARDLAERQEPQSVGTASSASAAPAVDVLLPFGDEPADEVEPLLATRPVKAPRTTRPAPLAVDVTLDDIVEPAEAETTAASSNYGPIDFEPVDVPRKS